MSHLDDRLERDLQHIADRATPSSDAWEAIQTRIAEQANQTELEITMLKPNPNSNPDHAGRAKILAAAAAVTVVVLGALVLFANRSNDTDTIDRPTTTSVPSTTSAAPSTTDQPSDGEAALPNSDSLVPMAVVGESVELVARVEAGEGAERVRSIFPFSMDLGVVADSAEEVDDTSWVRVLSADGRDLDGWVDAEFLINVEGDLGQPQPLFEMASSVRNALLLSDPSNRLAERTSGVRVSVDGSFSDDDPVYEAFDLSQSASSENAEVVAFIEDFVATTALQETDRISINTTIKATDDNSASFFPGATIVELHYSGDEGNEDSTWESMLMVFLPNLNTGATDNLVNEDSTEFELVGLAFHSPAANLALAEGFIAARNEYDGEAVQALLADDAGVRDDLLRDRSGNFLELEEIDFVSLADFDRITGVELADHMCAPGSPGRVRCTYTWSNAWSRALGDDRYDGNSFVFDVVDGRISNLTHTFAQGPVDGFVDHISEVQVLWIQTNHPDDVEKMFTGDGLTPSSEESLALWEAYTEEFVASVDAS